MPPYIDTLGRSQLDAALKPLLAAMPDATEGQLNYTITKLLLEWLPEPPNYAEYNAIVGVLECVKLEIYRRRVVVYEDGKRHKHGDVF